MCEDLQVVTQISLSERNGMKKGYIDMVSHSWVFSMELCHFSLCMELVMHMPAIYVTIIVSLPLDKVLRAIVPHLTVYVMLLHNSMPEISVFGDINLASEHE
jgi:hypothetical protein